MNKKIRRVILILLTLDIILIAVILFLFKKQPEVEKISISNFINKELIEVENFCEINNIELEIKEEFSNSKKGTVINQSLSEGTIVVDDMKLEITISKGLDYETLKVNESGNVPIMMYHGIQNITDNKYTGGNIDKDGYQRTAEAFKKDLEFYYSSGYRMIRLNDYINGKIDVEAGKSPIILTFDDGLSNNITVTGLDEEGNIIIDENSAVGILEQFKKKYPDFNVTATFFLNGGLFQQSKYNEKILNWLVDNGYDIGNHSYSHADFTTISKTTSIKEIGSMYNLLDKYISGKYVNIVALPFGSPYKKSHENFETILSGTYNDKAYQTVSTLRVGWEAETSPFDKDFDKTFLKRIRAYDNLGVEFDIEMNFKILNNNRYISDGDSKTITIPKDKFDKIGNTYDLEVITY